jgi:hypothetical protein
MNLIMSKIQNIEIGSAIISITKIDEEDYICLTDMAKTKEGDNRAADIIKTGLEQGLLLNFLEHGKHYTIQILKLPNLTTLKWKQGYQLSY